MKDRDKKIIAGIVICLFSQLMIHFFWQLIFSEVIDVKMIVVLSITMMIMFFVGVIYKLLIE